MSAPDTELARSARGAGPVQHVKGQVMKLNRVLATGTALAVAMIAGPAFAADGDQIAAVGTSSVANIGYAAAALAVMAGPAIGLAYLSGTIKTGIGWGKSRK